MLCCALVAIAALAVVCGAEPGNAKHSGAFCAEVSGFMSWAHEQQQATAFCSSYLHISAAKTTRTITRAVTVTSTATASVTATAYTTITASTVGTVISTATATATATTTATVTTTSSGTVTTNNIVDTSTVFYSTITSTQTITSAPVTTTSTITTTTTTQQALAGCSVPNALSKRDMLQKRSVTQPTCFVGYTGTSLISRACSCLSIPQRTTTTTVLATTTNTAVVSTKQTTTKTGTSTVTTTAITTATITTTTTATVTNTVTVTTQATATVTIPVTTTVSLVATTSITITNTGTTSTTTTTTVATATLVTNFALLASYNQAYGLTKYYSGGHSGMGIYFSGEDVSTAATFSFGENKLYYDEVYVNSYQESSGNFYPVVERPYAQLGFNTICTLNTEGGSGGCPLHCLVTGSGLFPSGSGNNVNDYDGTWGLQGHTNDFTVYAVGQT